MDSPISTACFHSSVEPDCLGCAWGVVHRLDAYIARLRDMVDPKALALHDAYWFGGDTPRQAPTHMKAHPGKNAPLLPIKYPDDGAGA